MTVKAAIERVSRRGATCMVPQPVPGQPGLLTVDATWGTITPMQIAPGVVTVGELEVVDHIGAGLPLVDTRLAHFFHEGTIPGARNIPHESAGDAIGSLDPDVATIFFCNGPQCAATPDAIRALLARGYPPEGILFYRGGIHDWVTLGLPVEIPRPTD
jgi:rhodanese-related sulfurtransferase